MTDNREDFQRLGVLGDWKKPYRTMDFKFEAEMLRSLAKIIERGHLARGVKPVHWCFDCGSALAEAEIEYADKISPAVDVAYDAIDPKALAEKFGLDRPRRSRRTDLDHHAVDAAGQHGGDAGPGSRLCVGRRPGAGGIRVSLVVGRSPGRSGVAKRYGVSEVDCSSAVPKVLLWNC